MRASARPLTATENGYARGSRDNLLEELEPFPGHLLSEIDDSRDIPAGPSVALNQASSNRVVVSCPHDDRNRRRRPLGCFDRTDANGKDAIHIELYDLGRQGRKHFGSAPRKAPFDNEVPALDPSQLA
jgi:hypothetical protein